MADATSPVSLGSLSTGQLAFFLTYGWVVALWLLATWLNYARSPPPDSEDVDLEEPGQKKAAGEGEVDAKVSVTNGSANGHSLPVSNPAEGLLSPSKRVGYSPTQNMLDSMLSSNLVKCVRLDLNAIQQEQPTLKAMVEFGTIMVWYFVADRTSIIEAGPKSYSRDVFAFIFLILTLVAIGTSMQVIKQPVLLARQQTEEWKGWMQILFLLYHYFNAAEVYNAIRLFIAAYVWMTGFGNFSYYYKTNDFCIGRFAQMMWRLNFLVIFACIVLKNSYMLYYICPMHTIFTVMVYASLGIASHLNQYKAWIIIKLLLCLASVMLLWDVKAVFYAVWWPFRSVVGYLDPRKPDLTDELYEWYFRSGLDRYVWIYGMLCAFIHPWYSSVLSSIDNMPLVKRTVVRSAVLAGSLGVGYVWYTRVYVLPKVEYNKVHPYTSWIPITLWIIFRNFTPTLRLHHLRLYGWLGCITLETYICQFHIWMKTSIPDGQPKALLVLLPGYPLLNFALVSAGYIFISHRLFELTNTLKNAAVPHSNNPQLLRNVLMMAAAGTIIYVTTFGLNNMFLKRIL